MAGTGSAVFANDDRQDGGSGQFATDDDLSPEAANERLIASADGIVSRLGKLAEDAVSKKSSIQNRWLISMAQYHGRRASLYDIDEPGARSTAVPPQDGKSTAEINMTRPKTLAWAARLSDLLFPADDKNWGIGPTPVPELADKAKQAAQEAQRAHEEAADAVEQHNINDATGTVPEGGQMALLNKAAQLGEAALAFEKAEDEARAIMDEAKRRADAMSKEIDDQLTQCQYPRGCRRVIMDMCRLGVGVMKGPLNGSGASRWTLQDGAQTFTLAPKSDTAPVYMWVDPWSFFPDPNARTIEESEYEFQRHLPNRSQLRRMVKELGFYTSTSIELLREGPGTVDQNLQFLNQLRSITNEGQSVQNRFAVWEYHGPLEYEEVCTLLRAFVGDAAAEQFESDYTELDEVRVIAYFCNGKLLKLEPDYPLDSGETLYSVVSFDKSDTSVLGGYGVPDMMRDPARAVAAAWRMLMDNAGLSAGPQIVVDKAHIEPEDGSWALQARKVWVKSGDDVPSDAKVFEVFNIEANLDEIIKAIELGLKFIDEVTSLPLIAQGEQGAHITQTAGGMSMLMNSANVIFRSVVKNFDDDLTTPNIRRLYDWNMQFNPKEAIKGDLQVEARGTSALLVREMQSQNLMAIATEWSNHPVLGKALRDYGYDCLRMAVASLSINPDDILGTRDEFDAAIKEAQENPPPDPNVIRANATIEAAKIDAESRKTSDDTQLQIANLKRDTELLKVQEATGQSREQIAADLEKLRMQLSSQERNKAVDIAVEGQRAAEARAEGQPASDATGKGVG